MPGGATYWANTPLNAGSSPTCRGPTSPNRRAWATTSLGSTPRTAATPTRPRPPRTGSCSRSAPPRRSTTKPSSPSPSLASASPDTAPARAAPTSNFVERSSPRSRRSCAGCARRTWPPPTHSTPRGCNTSSGRGSTPSGRGHAPARAGWSNGSPLSDHPQLDPWRWRSIGGTSASTVRSTAPGGSAPGPDSRCRRPGWSRSSPEEASPGR